MARKIDSIVSRPTGPGGGVLQSLGHTLLARRDARQQAAQKAPPPKLTLTTTKEKQKVIEEMMSKRLPSALSLLKMRQRAAKGQILDGQARDFLNRSQAGKKLVGTETLEKFTEEALQAELDVTAADPHSPIDYKLRDRGTEHLKTKARTILKDVRRDLEASQPAVAPNAMDIRRQRLSIFHGMQARLEQPTTAPAPAYHAPAPMFQAPTLLTANEGSLRSTTPLFAANTAGSQLPGSHQVAAPGPAVGLGVPVYHSHVDHTPSPTSTTDVPAHAATSQTDPSIMADRSTPPPPPSPSTETTAVGDALDGSGEDT